MWAYGRGQTDTQTRVTTIHFASSTTHAKCNNKVVTIRVNLAGSLGDAEADPEGLVVGDERGPPGEESEEKNTFFSLELEFCEFRAVFSKICGGGKFPLASPHSKLRETRPPMSVRYLCPSLLPRAHNYCGSGGPDHPKKFGRTNPTFLMKSVITVT